VRTYYENEYKIKLTKVQYILEADGDTKTLEDDADWVMATLTYRPLKDQA
jgi:hypothetical protein